MRTTISTKELLSALGTTEHFALPPLPEQDLSDPMHHKYLIVVTETKDYPTMVCAVHARTKKELVVCTLVGKKCERDEVIDRLVEKMTEAGWTRLGKHVTTHLFQSQGELAANLARDAHPKTEGPSREQRRRLKQAECRAAKNKTKDAST